MKKPLFQDKTVHLAGYVTFTITLVVLVASIIGGNFDTRYLLSGLVFSSILAVPSITLLLFQRFKWQNAATIFFLGAIASLVFLHGIGTKPLFQTDIAIFIMGLALPIITISMMVLSILNYKSDIEDELKQISEGY